MNNLIHPDKFVDRHLGPDASELAEMLQTIGVGSLEELIDETIPAAIRNDNALKVDPALSEYDYLNRLRKIAAKNKVFKSYIGMGYYNCITPSVIQRNIFENPGWYTQYTPYQAEISQGRLEALLNFQTMVSDLTALPLANASLLDEATAVAEAMIMAYNFRRRKVRDGSADTVYISENCFPHTIEVVQTRAEALDLNVVIVNEAKVEINEKVFALILQYPNADGEIKDFETLAEAYHENGSMVIVAADLMSLALLKPPGEWGADVVVGSTQRFGVPMGFGGPHAAYFATKESFVRMLPGRIIGVSKDANGKPGLRMTLQTREQHIRRDKATSNICTAQALLAIMAGMYAVYHGPQRLAGIASRIHQMASILNEGLKTLGILQLNGGFFDTLSVKLQDESDLERVKHFAQANKLNFYYPGDNKVGIAVDETTSIDDIALILVIFAQGIGKKFELINLKEIITELVENIPSQLARTSDFLTHPIFNSHHSETAMMRYILRLEEKDLSLNTAMIPLGSCTMKLNAATELMPLSWPEFAHIHPFAPSDQAEGYYEMIDELGRDLCEITGFAGISFQPNSGAQGEYAGLLVMRAYHEANGDHDRKIVLVPSSAHGTNPASAVMAGLKVVVVKCDERGNIDMDDFRAKAETHSAQLSGVMITYPSTHGVFEETIIEICNIVHDHGGQVYMDGANMNAQVGLTSPGFIGADVCHLNLHKTFSIPHGGGGPGMGPIGVAEHLVPFLPGHCLVKTGGEHAIKALAAAPFSSASILLISYSYIKMLGSKGLVDATKYAILNANYLKARLATQFDILYTGNNDRVAHEFILDLREFKHKLGLEVDDITKRLIDYGFHAPTVSWPVPGTIMIEPTESEPKAELDRFCDAMFMIREEIKEVEMGTADPQNNVLKNSPHTVEVLLSEDWDQPYSREKAAFPIPSLRVHKFWAPVGRVDNTYGDRNIFCVCPPIESYQEELV